MSKKQANVNLINPNPIFPLRFTMYEAKIQIKLKKGVSDPEGQNTLKALQLLGFKNVKKAQTHKTIQILIDEKNKEKVKKDVEQMCQRLLTNPVIHNYEIDIQKKSE